MKSLPFKLKIYLFLIYVSTFSSLFFVVSSRYIISKKDVTLGEIIFFIILYSITESFAVAYRNLAFSPSFAITISSFILFGTLPTILVLGIGFSLRVVKLQNRHIHILNSPLYKTLFNICIYFLSFIYSSILYILILNTFNNKALSYFSFTLSYFVLNTLLISILKSILSNEKITATLIQNVRLIIINILIMAPFGVILSHIYTNGFWWVILFLFPILLARFTFSLYIEVKSRYIKTVDVLMRAMEARDKYTEGHSHRVAKIVEMIAHELNYNESKIEQLNIASLLHDVGKIGIDDNILNKPGKLTDEEYELIKTHPVIGYNILKDIEDFKDILLLVKHHHERFDGKGYPDGKNFENLTLDVFIIQLADAVDAMATDRPYRPSLHDNFIIEELKKNSGTQFHPIVVDAYIRTQLKKGSEGK